MTDLELEARLAVLEERVPTTLSVVALTLGDFRARLEALERTPWRRFRAWFKANVYEGAS